MPIFQKRLWQAFYVVFCICISNWCYFPWLAIKKKTDEIISWSKISALSFILYKGMSLGIRYKHLRQVRQVMKSFWKMRTGSKRSTHMAWKSPDIQLVQYAHAARWKIIKPKSSGTNKQVMAKLTVKVTTQWSILKM